MIRAVGIGILAAMWLFAQADKKPGYRTSPTGYNDTPYLPDGKWRVHDIARPRPPVVTPATKPGDAPSDAIVLFDGKNLDAWVGRKGRETTKPSWKIENGYIEATHEAGSLETKESFGDVQIHLEWATPTVIDGDSQWRGNSGIEVMGRYEIQVLDSYNNVTYADGQAGAMYGQYPPMVNASRKPGEWQTYDIVWESPRWKGATLVKPARVTLFYNGVLVQNAKEFVAQVSHRAIRAYEPHPPELPLRLQNHDTPVRYRNIWIRKLAPYENP